MSCLISFKEAANYLGIKRSTLYKYTSSRKIPHVKVGRLVKFQREDLDDWIGKHKVEPILKNQ